MNIEDQTIEQTIEQTADVITAVFTGEVGFGASSVESDPSGGDIFAPVSTGRVDHLSGAKGLEEPCTSFAESAHMIGASTAAF